MLLSPQTASRTVCLYEVMGDDWRTRPPEMISELTAIEKRNGPQYVKCNEGGECGHFASIQLEYPAKIAARKKRPFLFLTSSLSSLSFSADRRTRTTRLN